MTHPLICKTEQEKIVAHLWSVRPNWCATHELMGKQTAYGFIGSAGHVRARELARNDCPEKLRGKVERARGGAIGLDPRYEYFRFRQQPSRAAILEQNRRAVDYFDNYQSTQSA